MLNNNNPKSPNPNQNPNHSLFLTQQYDSSSDEEEDEEWENGSNPISTPFINAGSREVGITQEEKGQNRNFANQSHQFSVLAILVTALRKSLITCSVETEDISSLDISGPTEVQHLSHVTFDRFNGFLGLPAELQPEVPRRVPSASASVFGVSAKSMQCSYDERGNSVPTILLMMQKRLYMEGGLRAEGIFRINAENSQEEHVRNQLNSGVVPRGIDIHCLAGLIKAWLRELPTGVLDSLTPEQVMHCNTEDECTQLVKQLPPTEAALLDWAINLMADVVENEHQNKMNARNIAMVFAPNMTQMADPLTALIHAVQVMNFLKTLIMKTLRVREEESASKARSFLSCSNSPNDKIEPQSSNPKRRVSCDQILNGFSHEQPVDRKYLRTATLNRLESDSEEKVWSFQKKSDAEEEYESVSGGSTPPKYEMGDLENHCKVGYNNGEGEVGILERLNLRKGVRKLCSHPVFQLSKPVKKNADLGIVNT